MRGEMADCCIWYGGLVYLLFGRFRSRSIVRALILEGITALFVREGAQFGR